MMKPLALIGLAQRLWGHIGRTLQLRKAANIGPRPCEFPRLDRLKPKEIEPSAGNVFDAELIALAAASVTHETTEAWGPEYDVIKAAFDPLFYFSQYPDIRRLRLDPVGHYLRAGARENRDPAPWFSTAEYRRTSLSKNADPLSAQMNPFYHYLTKGRAVGASSRGPANYDIFCASLGLDVVQTSERIQDRMGDVRERLCEGVLGEMVMKASELDPLIGRSWRAGLRVRVPPASNAIGVRRIGHLIDLQQQAQQARAKVVVVATMAHFCGPSRDLQSVLDHMITWVLASQIVVVCVDGPVPYGHVCNDVRTVDFTARLPGAKDYKPARTLAEFIRSMRPEVVVNMDAKLMNAALRSQGKAIAATSIVYQFLGLDEADDHARATLGSKYYRAIDLHQRVIVQAPSTRDDLAVRFSLSDAAQKEIWVLDEETAQHMRASA